MAVKTTWPFCEEFAGVCDPRVVLPAGTDLEHTPNWLLRPLTRLSTAFVWDTVRATVSRPQRPSRMEWFFLGLSTVRDDVWYDFYWPDEAVDIITDELQVDGLDEVLTQWLQSKHNYQHFLQVRQRSGLPSLPDPSTLTTGLPRSTQGAKAS